MPEDPKIPSVPNLLHPQAKALGKNKFNQQKKSPAVPLPVTSPVAPPNPAVAVPAASIASSTPKSAAPAPKAPPVPKDSSPGKDKSYFELTIKLVGSEEPPFVVEVELTGNGVADKASAISVAKKKHPRRAMTILNSRIYTKTEGALTEISPGSTLSSLFGATGEVAEDLVEVGKAFHDGSRGTLFLRNLRSHIGLAFRPATGGLIVYSNRVASNRLASELPMIVSEILGNGAREIQIYLK